MILHLMLLWQQVPGKFDSNHKQMSVFSIVIHAHTICLHIYLSQNIYNAFCGQAQT